MSVILAVSTAACTAAKSTAGSRAVVLAVRHVAAAASETRKVNGKCNGQSTETVARPGSAQTKRKVSVRQRSLIR
jgi:hypothetical protein